MVEVLSEFKESLYEVSVGYDTGNRANVLLSDFLYRRSKNTIS